MKTLPQIAMLALLTAVPGYADYQAGLDAYQAGDYASALAEWRDEINQPAPPANLAVYREALYAIAMLYWKGEGVAQDFAMSSVWLKQAADINHAGAQVKLGYLYSTGQGVPLNYQEARRWLEMAAVQGDPDAAYNLDILDREGLGWPNAGDDRGPSPVSGQVFDPAPEPSLKPGLGRVSVPEPGPASRAVAGAEPTAESQASPPLLAEAEPSPPAPSEPRAAVSETAAPVSASSLDEGEEWILRQDPEAFTIQVVAVRHPENLHAFMAKHPGWSPFAVYRPAGYESPLWVLIQGVYPEVEAARAAAAVFPTGLQQPDKMWIRKFGMVQKLIE